MDRCTRTALTGLCIVLAADVVPAGGAVAQGGEDGRLHSDEFGLTVEWPASWEAEEATAEGGVMSIQLWDGRESVMLWAAPAFGGDEALCVDNTQWRLEADARVANVERTGDVLPAMFAGGTSALFRFDFLQPGQQPAAWTRAVWCRTLQPGHSVVQVELEVRADLYEAALAAAATVVVTPTEGLTAPAFPLAAERDDITGFWSQQFAAWGDDPYRPPSYSMFSTPRATACGMTDLMDGPFYCTGDNAVYFDAAATDDLRNRYGAPIVAFLLAHETGHHVAWLLGYTRPCRVEVCLTELTDVQWELLADCFAGGWLASAVARGVLTDDDIEEVLVGMADTFSDSDHGSSALRLWWTLQGFHLGVNACLQPPAA
jgi:hypothetical protein